LTGIAAGAEVNQNAFSNVKVGDTTIAADSKTDTLTITAGDNITLTPTASSDTFSIAAKDTTYSAGDGLELDGTEFNLTASGVTAGTYGEDEAARTLAHSGKFDVVQVKVDAFGRITSMSTKTLTLPSSGNVYTSAYCTTDAATAAKTASCSGYVLTANTYVLLVITKANSSAGAITLNINGTGAKALYINGAASSSSNYTLPAGSYIVHYDGTQYQLRTDGILPGKIMSAKNADTVNGKTVAVSVPSGAKFTDTTYSVGNGLVSNDTVFSHALNSEGLAADSYGPTADVVGNNDSKIVIP
jgi:hypothetical protein